MDRPTQGRLQPARLRDRSDYLVDRYSERKADGREVAGADLARAAMAHEVG